MVGYYTAVTVNELDLHVSTRIDQAAEIKYDIIYIHP